MTKMYQVFVSSTYSDLRDERRKVSEVLAKANYIPAGMELFPAADQQQFEFIKRVIDRCDYYVVIIGGRYGTLADDSVSFTEREFEYALERGMPVLAFLHKSPETIQVGKTDQDASKAEKLQKFSARLASRDRMVDYWEDANDLAVKVVIAVGHAATLFPGLGWIRGDQAIDPRLLQELELLRAENAALKVKLSSTLSDEPLFDPKFNGPDDSITFPITHGNQRVTVSMTLGALFLALYDELVAGPQENRMGYFISHSAAKAANRYEPSTAVGMNQSDVMQIRNQFEAMGLIETESVLLGPGSNHARWLITPKGKKFAAFGNVMRKTAS